MARAFTTMAIERWEREGRINSEKAASLQSSLSNHEVRDITMHMGAHLILSVAIAVPIPGLRSLARFTWTASFRMNAFYNRLRDKISKEEYQLAKSIHSVPVMIMSLIPGVGAVAYVASGTMIRNGLARVLFDQCMYKLPFGLYQKLCLARIMATQSAQSVERYSREVCVHSNVNRPVQVGTGKYSFGIVPRFSIALLSSVNSITPILSPLGLYSRGIRERAYSANGPPVSL